MSTLTKDELVALLSKSVEEFNEQIREEDTGVDLSECDFSHMNLNGADFTGCDLNDSVFVETDLVNVSFVDTDLTSTNFTRANIVECDFSGSLLNGTDFSYAKVDYCNFTDSDMAGSIFVASELLNSDFSSSVNLNASRFDEDTVWPDVDMLPDDFDTSYISDLSSLHDEEDNVQDDIY
jgi:uncharacterized protein YjbI with pentapeptide repeats